MPTIPCKSKCPEPSVENVAAVERRWRAACPDNFLVFCYGLTIAGAEKPEVFLNVIKPHQKDAFEDVAPAMLSVRDGRVPQPHNRFWWERTKKAGKDSDLAICVLWQAAFPKRPFYGQIAAGDREQAGIVKARISDLLFYNPWLNDYVELVQNEVRSKVRRADGAPLAKWDILAADVVGSHGGTPDILVINELSHINKWGFVQNLMANAAGVSRGIVMIATNAGIKGSEAWMWRDEALAGENWAVRIYTRRAPWISPQFVKEQKKQLRGPEYRRLWGGAWISGTGGAARDSMIDRVFCRPGPEVQPTPGWTYLAGLDLGVSHDHAGVVVVGVNDALQKVRVALLRGWAPASPEEGGEVDLMDVEQFTADACRQFGVSWLGYDPAAGGSFMAQRLRRQHAVNAVEVKFGSPTVRTAMAEAYVQAVESGVLEAYEDMEGRLRRDMGKFHIKEKPPSGCQLVAVSDAHGHADVGTALIILLPRALVLLGHGAFGGFDENTVVATRTDPEAVSQDEVDQMPKSLRDIYELERRIGKQGFRSRQTGARGF